jgi:phage terminase small subunit
LAAAGKRLWSDVLGAYELTPGEREVLVALCHAVDQLGRLNAEMATAPLMIKGSRGQQVPNPLLAQIRASAKSVESLQRALCLPPPGEKVGKFSNPHTASSVNARWSRAATKRARDGVA